MFGAVMVLLFLFFFGSFAGWLLELFFRRFFSKKNPERKWLNPGFLIGPCVPLYGFGVVTLFLMSLGDKWFIGLFPGSILAYVLLFFIMALAMTAIEYIAGLIFVKGMHMKLWDYSDKWGNIQGIICPQFMLIWGVLAALYFFFVYPPMIRLVTWFSAHIEFSFFVGCCTALFAVDMSYSLNLGAKIRRYAKTHDTVLEMDGFLRHLRKTTIGRARFLFQLPPKISLEDSLNRFVEFLGNSPAKLAEEESARKDTE